ncbi:MAG: DUF89 family protein [Oscillospiraceae bacterium]|nr:DUF89 family protein [Oscillospiraceae bacterium]
MSIEINTECLLCHLRRNLETARSLGDEQTAMAFARELMGLYLDVPEDASSSALTPAVNKLFRKYYGLEEDRFRKEKEESNRFVLARMEDIRGRVEQARDPLYAALQFAILGNYIDFSALQGKVSFQKLDELLEQAAEMDIDSAVYHRMCQDLKNGKKLLYLTDNAGEICFDRIFAEQIQKQYPHLQITFCVRGVPVHNDATREDAAAVGIPFPVVDNGNGVGGTELSLLSEEAKQAVNEADVIIAKGQGNTETLYGCGLNIYYAFLIKCSRFVQVFRQPLLTPMLVAE